MSNDETRALEELLRKHGLDALLPVQRVAQRVDCSVWQTRLVTPYGDADIYIQLYPLGSDPAAFVDIEEEVSALTEDGSSRFLAQDIREDDWGILITCATEDRTTLGRFFQEGVPLEQAPTYHPQLDRILGGDYFHQWQGKWMKACLASIERAMEIKDLLALANEAYRDGASWPGKLERPLPVLLAILQVPAMDLVGEPESYNDLGLLQFVVESPNVLNVSPVPNDEEVIEFARQLFGFLATQHRAGLCFHRDIGSCLRPEFLLGNGVLTDVYFLSRPDDQKTLDQGMQNDLWNAFLVACEESRRFGEPATAASLAVAVEQYTHPFQVEDDLHAFIQRTAHDIINNETALLAAFVNIMLLKR